MTIFERLSFRYPFRKYQRMILEQVIGQQKDHKYHLVAPPGAGKTIIGLELIRQFDSPAVVFAPTTTIQAQWYEKLGMFLENVTERQHGPATISANQYLHLPTYLHAS
jgi:superfamily II DNA or RNA helicase